MPVLQIKALPQNDPLRVPAAIKATCRAIAEVYPCAPEQVWATWETIEPGHYFEGDMAADEQPAASHPPIARLVCFEGKSPQEIELILATAATVLSESLGMPGNIFIDYYECKSGRVVAGDGIVRKTIG